MAIPITWGISVYKEIGSSAWHGHVKKLESGVREIQICTWRFAPQGFDTPQEAIEAMEKEILK